MPRELLNANITHVSYVDKGANKKQFFLTKSDEKPTFQKEVKVFINKEEEEQKLVYGVVYEPNVEDSHDDFMTAPEIEKAAHGFMKDARNIDKQHDFNAGVGEVVESYIAPADFTIGDETITKGSWVLVTKASDEVWEEIKKGEITGYSMAGTAETIEKNEDKKPVSESNVEDEEFKGFFNTLKNFFKSEKIQKGEVKDKYNKDRRRREFWAAQDALNSVIFNWDEWYENRTIEDDPDTIREALQDFVDIAQQVLLEEDIVKAIGKPPETIEKAGKKISNARMNKINAALDALSELKSEVEEEEEEVKKEDIEKMLDEKLSPITKRLDSIEKEDGKEETPKGEEDVLKQFGEVLDQKLAPINDRLDAVEKARGISKQLEQITPTNEQEQVQKGYMRHFG
ncbi:XkdF-like putative serine protease domain-containing protein [Heyndrickxia oleronia]|uniref:XkdF-like putative serine protease domain-containing protein n=1 Tax=Heyndrickxia oleronia TaxID=38875 RepID=UPI00204182B3|nr:XkdF-like putative serine protease domain-containing protein [Heyndrickxia oleronia]MCM3452743.1 XkdF-like putative serine protease domain-containing protein [Heyndrickxia oleronia]